MSKCIWKVFNLKYLKKTNRLAIFSFYDCEGHVDVYVIHLLQNVRIFVDYLVIVCNGNADKESSVFFREISDCFILRENIGYDAGGYKDAILWMSSENGIKGYNELILFNNTFFGFFYPLREMFSEMDKDREIDFWGITKHPCGELVNDYRFKEHIQAYFLVIRKKMFHSQEFINFWQSMNYPIDYHMAVQQFEIAFTEFFTEKGFVCGAYCDLQKIGIKPKYGENPYLTYGYELIVQMRCPVLKIKSIYIENSRGSGILEAIDYLQKMQIYDTDYIWQYLIRICRNGGISTYFDFNRLEQFCRRFPCLYVYGNGAYGKWIKWYLQLRNFPFGGFVVTHKNRGLEEEAIEYIKLRARPDAGWILALNVKNTREVLHFIRNDISEDRLLVGIK
jgi:Lipopolysaccharide biosynthesis protein